jgi:hypothetical protein
MHMPRTTPPRTDTTKPRRPFSRLFASVEKRSFAADTAASLPDRPPAPTPHARRVAMGGLVAIALLGGLSGCGKGGSSSSSPSSAADTSKPLDGRELGKASQLVGTWYRTTEGEYVGFEFMKDGNVLITHAFSQLTGGGMMMKYSVLEGGRLSLVAPNGQTMIFQAVVSGDNLELQGQQMLGEVAAQRFHRLRSGQTLAQAAQEERVAEAKARQERLDALEKYMKQPKLALVNADSKMRLDRMALEITGGNGNWSGTGYVEGNTVVARQVHLVLQNPEAAGQPYQMLVQFGNVIGPPGMKQLPGENMTFPVQGEPTKPEIGNAARALRPDAGAFDEIVSRYKKVVAEREAAIEKFADQFGSFTKLEGTLRYPNNPNAQPRRMALGLLRVEGKPAFLWADMGRDSNPPATAFAQPAGVILDGDTPYLNFGQGIGVLQAVTAAGKTTLQGQIQGSNAEFELVQTLSKDQVIKQRAAVAEFLDKKLAAGVLLSGSFTEDDRPQAPIRPVHIELKSDGSRNLGGVYHAFWLGAKCQITGKATDTLLGARFEIDATKVLEDLSLKLRNKGPMSSWSVEWVNGEPVFTGIQKYSSNGNHLDLVVDSPARLKASRERLEKLLAAGVAFAARTDGVNSTSRPPAIELKAGGAEPGKLAGFSNYTNKRGTPRAPLTGTIAESDGFVVLDIAQPRVPTDATGIMPAGTMRLWSLPDENGVLLSGYFDFGDWTPQTAASGRGRAPEQMSFWTDAK